MMDKDNPGQEFKQHTPDLSHPVERQYINCMLNVICSDQESETAALNIVNHKEVDGAIDLSINKHADIECKVFNIAGLNLAVPLSSVKSILYKQEVLPGSSKGLGVGKINNNGDDIRVIDLSFLMMNGECDFNHTKKYTGKKLDIVLLKGNLMGILFDKEMTEQKVLQQHVCWRNETSDRLWLAGTVKQYGLSLLDLEGILDLLNNEY